MQGKSTDDVHCNSLIDNPHKNQYIEISNSILRGIMGSYIPRYFSSPKQSYFLFGPRGTGKSTFLKHHYPDALWIDLLAGRVFFKTLHPFLLSEFTHISTFDQVLQQGFLPIVISSKIPKEVDFILNGEDNIIAIGVKNSHRIRPEDIRSLVAFHDDYPQCIPILLYRGQEKLMKNHIQCIPCELFLRNLIPNQPILLT